MTRKDFIIIAAALLKARPDSFTPDTREMTDSQFAANSAWFKACDGIAITLSNDNPRFDRKMFLKACGALS